MTKIVLTRADLRELVGGRPVTKDGVDLLLADIGYPIILQDVLLEIKNAIEFQSSFMEDLLGAVVTVHALLVACGKVHPRPEVTVSLPTVTITAPQGRHFTMSYSEKAKYMHWNAADANALEQTMEIAAALGRGLSQ